MDDKIHTSQQKAGEHSRPEGTTGGEATVDKNVSDGGGRGNSWDKTSQQLHGDHQKAEGN